MMVVEGERYCNAKEAATYLGINRCMFYNNVQEHIKRYQIGARKRKMYKVTELDEFTNVQQVFVAKISPILSKLKEDLN